MDRIQRLAIVWLMAIGLAACAGAARPQRMVPQAASLPTFSTASPLRGAITLTEVSGGEETNPMLHSNVGNTELRSALQSALQQEGLLSGDQNAARFRLKAVLLDLSHPLGLTAFTITIHAAIFYQLTASGNGQSLFDQIITTSHTATLSDEFLGIERLRIANEGAIRANIAEFLSRLGQIDAVNPVAAR